MDKPIMKVAIASGALLLVGILVIVGCVLRQRSEKEDEEIDTDENPVYRVYQLVETYERQYSTNEAVDNNVYYEQ